MRLRPLHRDHATLRVQDNGMPWPTPAQIRHGQATPFNRRWSCFDYTQCQHEMRLMAVVGDWLVEVCGDCGDARTHCEHINMEWNDEGTLLRCVNCGVDGT